METTKVVLYVAIATLSTFLMHFMVQAVDKGYDNLDEVSQVMWIVIVANSILSGLIAWKAKLSNSPEQEVNIEEMKKENKVMVNAVADIRSTMIRGQQ